MFNYSYPYCPCTMSQRRDVRVNFANAFITNDTREPQTIRVMGRRVAPNNELGPYEVIVNDTKLPAGTPLTVNLLPEFVQIHGQYGVFDFRVSTGYSYNPLGSYKRVLYYNRNQQGTLNISIATILLNGDTGTGTWYG